MIHVWVLYLCLASRPDRCVEFAVRPTYQACYEWGLELETRYPPLFHYCVRRVK